MKIQNNIPPALVTAAVSMLQPFAPELSPAVLIAALQKHEPESERPTEREQAKPVTRQEAARMLQISLPTLNRYCNDGLLKRIKLGKRLSRITRESLDAMLTPEA